MKYPTQKYLKEYFNYDPTTGALLYKHKVRFHEANTKAGILTKQGYRMVKVGGRTMAASWVVWIYHTGKIPKNELDHANMVRSDDRFENLREATRSQNCMNRVKKVSKWGYRGVKNNKKRFTASLTKDQKLYYFGTYDTREEAARAYDAGARIHFGEFAILNFPDKPKRDWLIV